MKKKTVAAIRFFLSIYCAMFFLTIGVAGEGNTVSDWRAQNLPFRVLNTISKGPSLWVCGTDEAVAVSSDAGAHWEVKHKTTDGAVLLNIGFANDKFGYAAGTGGVFLTTEDGGETWTPHSSGQEAIVQVSFSDPKHGLIRTSTSLLFTIDGGANWSVVSAGQNWDDLKQFPYTLSLVALDSAHMAVMMKEGPAQSEGQRFLVTEDSGKSWKFVAIPNATLYSFLRVPDKYWTVGTEVIHKDQPGGGYGVPVALYSSDGINWNHSDNDLSGCKLNMCVACTTGGCLAANGTIADLFSDKTSYKEFSPNTALTSKWAAAGSTVCFVRSGLQCAGLTPVTKPSSADGPLPVVVSFGPLGAFTPLRPFCVICSMDPILIDKKSQGTFTIKLAIEIAKNGIVKSVVAENAPTPEVRSRIEQQVQEWIFEPPLKDGVFADAIVNTAVRVKVIKPQ